MNLICTCAFTYTQDPQRPNFRHKVDNWEYIKNWCESIEKLGLNGLIFYDEGTFTAEFIDNHSSECISFQKVTPNTYTPADFRWIAYDDFLRTSNVDWVVFTDASDVVINYDPFEVINDESKVYIGVEDGVGHLSDLMKDNRWMKRVFGYSGHIKSSWLKLARRAVYNCGIVGGSRETIGILIANMAHTMKRINPTPQHFAKFRSPIRTVDMAVLNHSLMKYHISEIVSGNPLHNRYKRRLNAADREAAIWHKHR